jgi:hypothetical protein
MKVVPKNQNHRNKPETSASRTRLETAWPGSALNSALAKGAVNGFGNLASVESAL